MSTITAVANLTALAALASPADGDSAYVGEAGRSGAFVFRATNLSSQVSGDPQKGVYVAPAAASTGASGAWVRDLSGKALTPYHFGAVDGTSDSAVALQAFGDFIAANAIDDVDVSGDFTINSGLIWGTATLGEMAGKTPLVHGDLTLRAGAAMRELLRLRNWDDMTWDGSLHLVGIGGLTYSSRTCRVGLALAGCRAMKLTGRIDAESFSFAGVAFIDFLRDEDGEILGTYNNNYMHLGMISCSSCGSGQVANSLQSGFGTFTDSGSAGSTAQRTQISGVTTLPPAEILNNYGQIGDAPIQVRIDGYLYWVESISGSTITVYPWVRNPGGDNNLEWVFGGGLYLIGADGNVLGFDILEATNCGRGLTAASLYGPIGTVSAQFCGTGVLLGREPTSAGLGSKLSVYMEGNAEDIATLAPQGLSGYNYLTSEYALNLAKCVNLAAARTTGDVMIDAGFARMPIVSAGRRHDYEKRARNGNQAFSALTLVIDRRDFVCREKRNSWNVTLEAIDPNLNRLFGYDGATLIFHGTGSNGAPTGAFVFAANTIVRGATTSGSAVVTGIASTQLYAAGMAVTGTGIPSGTTILSIDSATQLTLSQAATATNSLASLTVNYATVNGAASASFSGFTKAASLSAIYDFAARNWDVRLLN
ncbi:MAG: hypothetical protein QOJ27_1597 [Sphingomonadales bacterium]|nr:hypothetical protein [Sphingomonadales bacterium]